MSTVLIQASRHRFGAKQNAKSWASKFRARLLEPGIVSYEDQDCGKALVRKETIDRDIHTFIGRPLILARDGMNRPTFTHARVRPATLEKMADGYISGVEYDPVDGWWYAVGTVHNDEAKQAIKQVGLVSCAYDVKGLGGGGDYHNIPYHEEITAFEGEHLAIVAHPRYEDATIRLNAKSNKKNNIMLKWIKKLLPSKTEGGEQKQNDVQTGEVPEGAALEIDGAHVPMADVVEGYRANGKTAQELDGASEIEVAGKPVSINELIASHQKLNAMVDEEKKKKDNAADEDEEKKKKDNAADDEDKDKEKKNKKNAEEEDDEDKKAKKNAKRFVVNSKPGPISQAREAGILVEVSNSAPETHEARAQRGRDRYGPKTK